MARKKLLFSPLAPEVEPTSTLRLGALALPAAQVGLRSGNNDTRPLSARHVVDLAESISVLGLLEPIVIDNRGRLLAGAHRRAAVQLLAIDDPIERRSTFEGQVFPDDDLETTRTRDDRDRPEVRTPEFAGLAQRIHDIDISTFRENYGRKSAIPVQVIQIPAAHEASYALAIEAAENNVRRPYTHAEIVELANRLRKAGYRTRPGKPKPGERTMLSALEAAVGRSKRQIQNILSGRCADSTTEWGKAKAALRRALLRVIREARGRTTSRPRKLLGFSQQLLDLLRQTP